MTVTRPAGVLDAGRLAAVEATGLLDTGADEAFDGLAQLAATLLNAPFAFVTLVDDRRSFWKSCIGVATDDLSLRQNPVEESFCQYVVNSEEPLIVGDVTANPITADNPSIESMGVAAWAGYPVWSPDGYVLGTFCVVDLIVRAWTDRDVEVLRVLSLAAGRELALRDAAARARRAARERDEANAALQVLTRRLREANRNIRQDAVHHKLVSRALQQAMLSRLPEPDHLQIAARYLTADSADQVGGDWYDAVVPAGGAMTLIVGDVCGHNIAAATVMGQLRNMLRAFVWDHPDDQPAQLIARLDAAMADLGIITMATLVVARIDEDEGRRTVRWSAAGHAAPVIVDAAGDVSFAAGRPDPPLATVRSTVRTDRVASIPEGATVLLYSDGLVETRALDIAERQQVLRDELAKLSDRPLDSLLDAVLHAMVGEEPEDDVALLAVRFDT